MKKKGIETYLSVCLTKHSEEIIKYYVDLDGDKITEDVFLSEDLLDGALLVFIGNLCRNDVAYNNSLSAIIDISNRHAKQTDLMSFFELFLEDCSTVFNHRTYVHSMLLDTFVSTYEYVDMGKPLNEIMGKRKIQANKKNKIAKSPSISEIFNFFARQLFNLSCMWARTHLFYLTMSEDAKRPKFLVADMIFNIGSNGADISYRPIAVHDGNSVRFCDIFKFNNTKDLIVFEFMDCLRMNVNVKICSNCGKYFIPKSKSNEIYCNNEYKNGKSCRQVGYENKVNSDEILKAYRTAYKTQNAKKLRNRHLPEIEDRFKKWYTEAKSKLADTQNGLISLDDFREWLKVEWLKGE